MQEIKMPHEPLSMINAEVKAEIIMAIRTTISKYPLPLFMVEGILSGILADIRAEAYSELASETGQYKSDLSKYYEEHEQALIKSFEVPDPELERSTGEEVLDPGKGKPEGGGVNA